MSDTLILNADAQPVCLLPLSTVTWQESIRYMVLNKARVLDWHEDWIVRSARWSTPVPAVLILNEYFKKKNHLRLTKRNIFLRDRYTCQYCGALCKDHDATIDHVIPISRGGDSSWTNLSTACKDCNYKKSDKREMRPKRLPHRPDFYELVQCRRDMGFKLRHPSWANYLG